MKSNLPQFKGSDRPAMLRCAMSFGKIWLIVVAYKRHTVTCRSMGVLTTITKVPMLIESSVMDYLMLGSESAWYSPVPFMEILALQQCLISE